MSFLNIEKYLYIISSEKSVKTCTGHTELHALRIRKYRINSSFRLYN